MSLFIKMFPFYLLGNLHCIGMCGPLVFILGRNRWRYFYFLGRVISFTLAGLMAGSVGAVLGQVLQIYQIPALTSFLFGALILFFGFGSAFGLKVYLPQFLGKFEQRLSTLLLKEVPSAVFLFGFFTVFLPCGQTLVVFSACALTGSSLVGALNGFAFALLTSPSLFFAMRANGYLKRFGSYHPLLTALAAIVVGALSLLKGLAELDIISHFVLNPNSVNSFHIVIY